MHGPRGERHERLTEQDYVAYKNTRLQVFLDTLTPADKKKLMARSSELFKADEAARVERDANYKQRNPGQPSQRN